MRTLVSQKSFLRLVCGVSSVCVNSIIVITHILSYADHTPLLIGISVGSQVLIASLSYAAIAKFFRL